MAPALKLVTATELLKRLKAVSKTRATSSMEFAQILYLLHELFKNQGSLHGFRGCKTWRAFVEREVQINKRQAERYIAIWEHFGVRLGKILGNKLNNPPPHSILREMARFTNESNIKMWWKKCRTMTFSEVAHEADRTLRQSQKSGSPRRGEGACFNFMATLTATELRKMERALDIVRSFESFTRKGALLSVIVEEWVSLQPKVQAVG